MLGSSAGSLAEGTYSETGLEEGAQLSVAICAVDIVVVGVVAGLGRMLSFCLVCACYDVMVCMVDDVQDAMISMVCRSQLNPPYGLGVRAWCIVRAHTHVHARPAGPIAPLPLAPCA